MADSIWRAVKFFFLKIVYEFLFQCRLSWLSYFLQLIRCLNFWESFIFEVPSLAHSLMHRQLINKLHAKVCIKYSVIRRIFSAYLIEFSVEIVGKLNSQSIDTFWICKISSKNNINCHKHESPTWWQAWNSSKLSYLRYCHNVLTFLSLRYLLYLSTGYLSLFIGVGEGMYSSYPL